MLNIERTLGLTIDQVEKDNFAIHLHVGVYATRWHQHRKHQLLYAEDGVLTLQTEAKEYILPARRGAWIPGQLQHRVSSRSPGLYLRTLYFGTGERGGTVPGELTVFSISALAREMILYTQRWSPTEQAAPLERRFFQAIRLLVPEWCSNPIPLALPTTEQPQLQSATESIRANLSQLDDLPTIAGQYGMSERTLQRLFKKELGMTYQSYVRVARIIEALERLIQPGASVTDVAYAVGYKSLSSFSQTFRLLMGMSPRQFLEGLGD
jgi:AraC-like DNA-binding protein